MAQATYDPGNPYGMQPARRHLRGWVLGVPVLLGIAGLGYALWTREPSAATTPQAESSNGWRPSWEPTNYTQEPPPPPPAKMPDRTEAMLKELLAQQEALRKDQEGFRKELAELRKRPATPAPAAAERKPQRKHTPMVMIDHPPAKASAVQDDALHWLGAGTWIPCTVEPRLNSDVPGYFTVKTRLPLYDTKTGRHLLIQQNQSIVAKYNSQDLLFGNTRIPTFALTLSNPDGTSVDLGDVPITDQLGTNGLTGEVNNHIWRLVWTSIFIGGLRGGQQAIQAGVAASGDATGQVAASTAAALSQSGQQRLGRAQDTRPTIEVESGSLCNVLLTKAIQLAEISQMAQAR